MHFTLRNKVIILPNKVEIFKCKTCKMKEILSYYLIFFLICCKTVKLFSSARKIEEKVMLMGKGRRGNGPEDKLASVPVSREVPRFHGG